MRVRSMAVVFAAVFFGAMMGQLLTPQPASGVSREIVELQQSVAQLLQGQFIGTEAHGAAHAGWPVARLSEPAEHGNGNAAEEHAGCSG